MELLNRKDLDERIHSFLLKKTSKRNLGNIITDWISDIEMFGRTSERNRNRAQPWAEYSFKTR